MVHLNIALTSSLLFTTFSALTNAMSIEEALRANPNLSQFLGVLKADSALFDSLKGDAAKPMTIFAPSNTAFQSTDVKSFDTGKLQALIKYHILNGSYPATQLAIEGGVTAETHLAGDLYALLGQGKPNVVFASKFGASGLGAQLDKLRVYTGLGTESTVEEEDFKYDGGVLHTVGSFFSIPENCTSTSKKAKLNSLLTALDKTKLWDTLDSTPRVTCFAPSDEAFKNAGNPETSLNTTQLADALKYHTLQGEFVGYSDRWEDGMELQTLLSGQKLVVTKRNGELYVNDAKVLKANVIMSNGVAHVLDRVLAAGNNTHQPTPSGTETTVGPSDSKTATGVTLMIRDTAAILAMSLLTGYYIFW